MAIVTTDNIHYQAIANKVRELKNTEETMLPSEMPQKIEDCFNAGKQAEYDRFWDAYQNNGKRTRYETAFGGIGWNTETFKPKYDIVPTEAVFMFRGVMLPQLDLVEWLAELGVKLDFSNCTNMQYVFYGAYFKRIGEISLNPNVTGQTEIFSNCNIPTIDKVILQEGFDKPITFLTAWLENIDFEGTITQNCTLSSSKVLSVQSAKNAINHLANYAGTENEGLYSFKLHADTWTALETDSTAPDGNTWKDYVISLGWLT